ncbi:MAG: tetratricopeptide repeat protein [Candidatus Eisenbacteria bacterium]|nr:tetratricopeptide repeat protein [Candidatus Eisenbacteria bacterium]
MNAFALTAVVVAAAIILFAWRIAALRRSRAALEDSTPYRLGIDAMIRGDREEAVRHLTAAVREDPRNVDAYIKLGNLLREQGRARQAVQVHRELLVKRRLSKTVRNEIMRNLALDLRQESRWREVLESVAALDRSSRSDPEIIEMTRDAYEATGEYERAREAHKELLKTGAVGPELGVYRAHLALLALRAGDTARARSEFRAALKESPEGAALANVHLGDIAAAEGDTDRAIAYWMKIVTDRPECAFTVFERLEKAFFEVGDFGRMMGIYEDVVTRAPTSTHALIGLSRMLERKGSIDDAVRTAREAVKHEGESLTGHRRLSELLVRQERFEEAARAADQLLERLASDGRTCPTCGASTEEGAWRCPACRAWIDAC